MEKARLLGIIKKRFGDSDEDLQDLEIVMDALNENDNYEALKTEYDEYKISSEKAFADNDAAWRKRYRDRFFDGETAEDILLETEDHDDAREDDVYTIDDFLIDMEKENN